MVRPHHRRRAAQALTVLLLAAAAEHAALAKKMTLQELVDAAHTANPGLAANAAAVNAMEAQVSEAWRYWLPSGDLLSLLAPSPDIKCFDTAGNADTTNCANTGPTNQANINHVQWTKVFTRTEIKLIQPVYDFGKISAGVSAAEAGVSVTREKQAGALEEGSGYIDDGIKKIEKDLSSGKGTATVTDRLRLRTVRAELDARLLETRRLGDLARDSLRTLMGADAPADLDVDDDPFEPITVPDRPVGYYEDVARLNRPEARLLDHAVKAKWALVDLERRREYPDFVLIGTYAYAHASGVDDPQNAFYSHYFNTNSYGSFGVAAALRLQLDLGPKLARAARTRAEANEVEFRRSEALGGIVLDVRKTYGELREATARTEAVHKGERAGKAWISAVAQNFTVGLAEARDLSDALVAFFQMRARFLQSVFDQNVAAAALTRATGASSL